MQLLTPSSMSPESSLHSARSSGLTLIELLIAMAIFAIAMSALMSAMNNNTRNLTSLQNRTLAQWIATNRLVGFQSTGNYPRQKEEFEKVIFGGTGKPREWIIRIRFEDMVDKNFKHLLISVGEETNKEKQFYATVDTFVNVSRK